MKKPMGKKVVLCRETLRNLEPSTEPGKLAAVQGAFEGSEKALGYSYTC